MTGLPLEVLLEIVKWLSLEERMTHLAPVCRYFYAVMLDSSLWRTVNTSAEFTLCSFNSLFTRHAGDLRHLGFRYSQTSLKLHTDEFFYRKFSKKLYQFNISRPWEQYLDLFFAFYKTYALFKVPWYNRLSEYRYRQYSNIPSYERKRGKSYECQIAFKLMENPWLVYSGPSLKLKL